MKSSRRSSLQSASQLRSNSIRSYGRITKEDLRSAGLRRWDGRARITTDWMNLYHEPELFFRDGDLLIYLREPGQSSRGPSFRVHKVALLQRGFDFLLDKCVECPQIYPGEQCMMASCQGCDRHAPLSELYIPAPANADLTDVFDHHTTTRNFFAWLYNLPLTGRALGHSLIALKERIDYYRPGFSEDSSMEIISFADAQRYLDFRECVDHALAALQLAEFLQIEDLWIDAFAHCVGMSHRGISTSLEYSFISYSTKNLIGEALIERESRLEQVRESVEDFFENDLCSNFLGLSQSSRNHLDHFRSWLHSYHIEQHGFWPPAGFEHESVQWQIYSSMCSDFKSLYEHLVDSLSPTDITDISVSGGICILQNVQAFDRRRQYQGLPHLLPLLPREPDSQTQAFGLQRRKSWNPIVRRRVDKDKKKSLRVQALIDASNRDLTIMQCPLVRRYSEFELESLQNDSDTISMIEARKVRWILIYTVLQTLLSVTQTPKQVRNTEGLTYLLSCNPPKLVPWKKKTTAQSVPTTKKRQSVIEPDTNYLQSNLSAAELGLSDRAASKKMKQARRQSLPTRVTSTNSRPSTARSASFKNLINRRNSFIAEAPPMPKPPTYCEILVYGYGNGLNETTQTTMESNPTQAENDIESKNVKGLTIDTANLTMEDSRLSTEPNSAATDRMPELTPTSSASVSRESSHASSHNTWSKSTSVSHSDTDLTIKGSVHSKSCVSLQDLSQLTLDRKFEESGDGRPSEDLNHILDEEGLVRTVHFNTETWDALLNLAA